MPTRRRIVTRSRDPTRLLRCPSKNVYRWAGLHGSPPIMLTLEVRGVRARVPKSIASPAASATVGASSGNEVVVRARGVYGRHVRLFERDGRYHLDLFKGIETVQVNGRDFFGGAIARRRPHHDRRGDDHRRGGGARDAAARRGRVTPAGDLRARGRCRTARRVGLRLVGCALGSAGHRGRVPQPPAVRLPHLPRLPPRPRTSPPS